MTGSPDTPNGAVAALRTAAAAGLDVCFANPGTTEMEWVAALDEVPDIRPVLGLFEGVVTGAADGYARVTGRPALTLTHLGPGFANGIANLHNARRAHSPVVNIVGDHATWHLAADAPLTSDIASLAAPVSAVTTVRTPDELPGAMAEAITTASGPPSRPATVIVPQDCAWGTAPDTLVPVRTAGAVVDESAVALAAKALGPDSLLLLGGTIDEPALRAAARIRAATGCRVHVDTFCANVRGGRDVPVFDPVPYFPEQATEALSSITTAVTVGSRSPVAFFGYPNGRSSLLPDGAEVVELAPPGHPIADALAALADELGTRAVGDDPVGDRPATDTPTGALDVVTFGAAVGAHLPEHAVVVNEAATSGLGFAIAAAGAAPHVTLGLTGGAIGQGLPCAVGAAVGAGGRRVLALQADGSGMYTLQALWTMARESLDVTVLVCANRAYRILQIELHRAGVEAPGPAGRGLTDLGSPELDWVHLAHGMGVPAVRATDLPSLLDALAGPGSQPGPSLVEVLL